jgi:5-oxoprolinase (ATP-hydrolysing) subunit A
VTLWADRCITLSRELSRAIADAVKAIDPELIFYGGSGTALISEANECGLRTASEVFADRSYQPDGSLTPRSLPNALIDDPSKAVEQALQMVRLGTVTSLTGQTINIKADTMCLHGDGAHALEFAVALRSVLSENDIEVRAV